MKSPRIERLAKDGHVRWTLTPFFASEPNGAAVLVLPGGGYQHLATGHEGQDIAAWLTARGYDAWMLEYRIIGEKHPSPLGNKPLEDALEALEYIRKGAVAGLKPHAEAQGIEPGRFKPRKLGVWGFSAGGHLAATLATDPETPLDFAVLCYPVISLQAEYRHRGSLTNLVGDPPDAELVRTLSADLRVSPSTPPTFIFHTGDDPVVPVENALLFYTTLRQHGIPAELHIYESGSHGVGLAATNPALRSWPDLLADWMGRHCSPE